MYAVIATGGKQYKVAEGQILKLEKLNLDVGNQVHFEQVLLVANGVDMHIGQPLVTGAAVTAEVLGHGRHKKISIIKFRRRKHHMKRQGHRQDYTEVKISAININTSKKAEKKEE